MKTVKILHCADIHIGAAETFLGTAASRRQFETVMTFERIIDKARTEKVQIVLIAGDLFDSNNIEEALFAPVLEKIASAGQIKVVLAAGNHDPLSANSPFVNRKLPDNLYITDTKDCCITFEDLGVRVYGKSFENVYMRGTEYFSILPAEDEFINIGILHGELRGDINSNYNAISPEFIRNSRFDYLALGHVHTKTELEKIGKTYFAYSGCPEGQGFDELGAKGVYIGKVGKNYCELDFLPVSRRMHIHEKIDITDIPANAISEHILKTVSEKYGENYSDNLYKIELVGYIAEGMNLNISEISARVAAAVYFAKIKDSTSIMLDTEKLSKEVSLKGIFVKNMMNKINEAPENEKQLFKSALDLGLRAFSGKVAYDED